MSKLTQKQFLTLMLDTDLSGEVVSGWLLAGKDHGAGWNSLPMLGKKYQVEVAKHLFGHLERDDELWPAVCKNCRKHVGEVENGLLRDHCKHCRSDNTILTDGYRAATRLESVFKDAGIKTIAPIVMHLIENPKPSS